jgi:uncharacterized protein
MKKLLLIAFLLVSVHATSQVSNAIPSKPPASEGLVHDFTKDRLITRQQEEFLEQKLLAYDDSTSNQVAIVIVEDLKGYDANQFATEIGDSWGVGGSAKFDNGIVILISTGGGEGNRDAYIAVGRGLEGVIPDMTAGYIVDHELIPDFKNGNYYRGLDRTVDAIIKAAQGEFKAPEGYGKSKGIDPSTIIFIIFLIFILLSVIGNNRGGGYASRRGYRGWWGPFTTGGSWGSGGGWFGGSSGGGFGGFGGGSFGGGGAGGKW